MTKKTQSELEQPAKVYQLEAVDAKLTTVIEKLNTIANQTAGLVTLAQLDAAIKAQDERVKEAEDKIHLTYGPVKDNLTWFTRTVIIEGIVIMAQLILTGIIFLGGK